MQRIHWSEVMRENPDGSVTIYRPLKIGGVTLNNVTFNGGVNIGGIDLVVLKNKFLAVEKQGDVYELKGYYNQ